MRSGFLCLLTLFILSALQAGGQSAGPQRTPAPGNGGDFSTVLNPSEKAKVPAGVILVKGAWSSSSDTATPVPEGGTVAKNIYSNPYFGITYPLAVDFIEKHKGPPPSETGSYVLTFIVPGPTYKGTDHASVLLAAQDLFFTPLPASSALELANYKKDNLLADHKLELQPSQTKIAGHPFTFYAYWSPVAELHWYVLTTEIRCHAVEIVLTSRSTKLLEKLVGDLNKMTLPSEASLTAGHGGGDFPVCVKDYAQDNMIERVEPVFSVRRFNSVPVRIIIDKSGKVKHMHFVSAFPEQEKAISDALAQWRFRPYLQDGKPVEVETGLMFGHPPYKINPVAKDAGTTD